MFSILFQPQTPKISRVGNRKESVISYPNSAIFPTGKAAPILVFAFFVVANLVEAEEVESRGSSRSGKSNAGGGSSRGGEGSEGGEDGGNQKNEGRRVYPGRIRTGGKAVSQAETEKTAETGALDLMRNRTKKFFAYSILKGLRSATSIILSGPKRGYVLLILSVPLW